VVAGQFNPLKCVRPRENGGGLPEFEYRSRSYTTLSSNGIGFTVRCWTSIRGVLPMFVSKF